MCTHGCTSAKPPEPSFPTTNPAFSVPQVDRWKTCTVMSGRSMTHPSSPIFFKDKHLQRPLNLAKSILSRSVRPSPENKFGLSVMHVYGSCLYPTTAIPVTIFLLLRYLQASSFGLSNWSPIFGTHSTAFDHGIYRRVSFFLSFLAILSDLEVVKKDFWEAITFLPCHKSKA